MATRNRFISRYYELAQICVPREVADFILSKKSELRDCEARKVYEQLKEEHRVSPSYEVSQRLQYLEELFWVLSGSTPIYVSEVGERECVPTNELEREVSSFGFDKVQPCVVLSLRTRVSMEQKRVIREMIDIVEGKMRSFKGDFYLHDMLCFSRELCKRPILWTVSTSHTFKETLFLEDEAQSWADYVAKDEERVRRFVNGYDDTWMGSALRVSCSDDDLYYYHDGAVLHKVSRQRFTDVHDRYVQRVMELTREKIELKKAA